MPTDIPLSILIPEVLRHSPNWVWALLFVITLLGLAQTRDQAIAPARLLLMPVGLGALSLWGVIGAFGAATIPVAGWVAGVATAFAANRALRWPGQVGRDARGRYTVAGSMLPLLGIWAIFVTRYVVTVSLILHPGWAHDRAIGLAISGLYGLMSGLFMARAARIAAHADTRVAMAAA